MSDEQNTQEVTQEVSQESVTNETPISNDFLSLIEDESLKSETSLGNFKDVTSLAKSYVHLNKMMGSSIRIPSEEASDEAKAEFYNKLKNVPGVLKMPDASNQEELNAFYKALGRPDSPDNYDLKLPQDVPEELIDKETLNSFKEQAYNLGLNSQQVQKLIEFDTQRQMHLYDRMEQDHKQGQEILKKMWGNDFDNRSAAAKKMIEQYGAKYPEAAKQLLSKHVTDPLVYQMLAELGQIYQERGHIQAKSLNFGLTPEEARAKIQEIRSNASHPVNLPGHVKHKEALEQMSKLYDAAYPKSDNS